MEDEKENKIIVEKIRLMCQSIGITVKDLEKELGFPNGTIGKWAKAAKRPPFDRVEAVAKHFGCTVSFLRGENENTHPGEGSGLSYKSYNAAILFERAEPWLQDQVMALLKAAESSREALDASPKE